MTKPPIVLFHEEEIKFSLQKPEIIANWIKASFKKEGKSLQMLNYIFCSDNYLYQLNVEYLKHNTLTDVITFPYESDPIEGDVFISIDRVRDNAKDLEINFEEELHRVMIHGALHLMDYGDKTPEEKAEMTSLENKYLHLLSTNFI